MPAVPSCLLEPLWDQFAALLPARGAFVADHPLGCHRRRVADRTVFEHIVLALVHGSGYERISSPGCSDRTIRRRVKEWAELGISEKVHALALEAYDRTIGLGLAEISVDGCITKAPSGGEKAGRSPVDRGKQGLKRSVVSDACGVPLGIVSDGANRHDSPMLGPTLEAARTQAGAMPEGVNVNLDRGYDSAKSRALMAELGFTVEIACKGVPAPIQAGKRWVIERTHSWMNDYGKLRRCTEKRGEVVDFYLYLAAALVTLRMLIRRATKRYRWAGQWHPGDLPVLFVLDSGYDIVRLTWLLREEPVRLLGRIRADRVMRAPASKRRGTHPGRPPRHGAEFRLAQAATYPAPVQESAGVHDRFGQVLARCWGRLHPKLDRRGSWADHEGELPIVEGTLVHLVVERLPGNRDPKPLWLWHSDPDAIAHDVDRLWRIFLRRFDIEHTFRFFKQTLGLTRPRLRTPEQADRWVWLILAAYAQLRLARPLAEDLRRPWEKPLTPDQLTPGRVRRGYPRIRRTVGTPARAPKASHPGPGRPKGRTSTPAPRHPVGKKQRKTDMPRRGGAEQQP